MNDMSDHLKDLLFNGPKPPTLVEKPNLAQLQWLIAHPRFVAKIDKKQKRKEAAKHTPNSKVLKRDLYAVIQQYNGKCKNGCVKVKYRYASGCTTGRLYAQGPSMQSFPKHIRQMLTHGSCGDADMVNACPNILAQLCDMLDIVHPILQEYNTNRDRILQDIMTTYDMTRSDAKKVPMRLINGGKFKCKQGDWLCSFRDECTSTGKRICELFPDIYAQKLKAKRYSPVGSVISSLVCAVENRCILQFVEYLKINDIIADTLCFDGLHWRINGDVTPDLGAADQYVFDKTGFRVSFADKPIPLHPMSDDDDDNIDMAPTDSVFLASNLFNTWATEYDFMSCKAGMSMGKTSREVELLKPAYDEGKSILLICPRRASVQDVIGRLEREGGMTFTHYLNAPRNKDGTYVEEACQFLVTCYESLWRISAPYDYVIKDETRSLVCSTISPTNKDRMHENWDKLKWLTAYCEKALFLCADMNMDGAAYAMQDMLMANRRSVCIDVLMKRAEYARSTGDEALALKLMSSVLNIKSGTEKKFQIKRHEDNRTKMHRIIKMVQRDQMLLQMTTDIQNGLRIGIPCASIKEAHDISTFIHDTFGTDVGVYTSMTDNHGDFDNITAAFDDYQVIIFTTVLTVGADYNTSVDRLYVYPKIHTATPQQMHQMIGRFRKVTTGEVWVCASEDTEYINVTRKDVDDRFKVHLKKLHSGHEHMTALNQMNARRLKFTVDSVTYTQPFQPPPPELTVIKAYLDAEESYTQSNSMWLSFFLYMCKSKGYNVQYGIDEDPADVKEELTVISEMYHSHVKQRTENIEKMFDELDVKSYKSYSAIQTLEALAAGQYFKDCEKSMALLKIHLNIPTGDIVPKETIMMMVLKAQALVALPSFSNISYSDAKAFRRLRSGMQNYIAMTEMVAGDTSNIIAMQVDLMLESKDNDKSTSNTLQLRKCHSVAAIHAADKLVRALGCTDIFDRETEFKVARFESAKVQHAVKYAREVGLTSCNSTPTAAVVTGILRSALGMLVHVDAIGKDKLLPDTLCNLQQEPIAMTFINGPNEIIRPEWFNLKWDRPAPTLNHYKPDIANDSHDHLLKLIDNYSRVRGDPEYEQIQSDLSTYISEHSKRKHVEHIAGVDVQAPPVQAKKQKVIKEAPAPDLEARQRLAVYSAEQDKLFPVRPELNPPVTNKPLKDTVVVASCTKKESAERTAQREAELALWNKIVNETRSKKVVCVQE